MKIDDKRYQSFPLRISPSLRQQASDFATSEGISLNHFISMAVAEKISRMDAQGESTTEVEDVTPGLTLVGAKKNQL